MDNPIQDRRRVSQFGLLDAAIRSLTTLAASSNGMNQSLANQALANLRQLRRELPARREQDTKLKKS